MANGLRKLTWALPLLLFSSSAMAVGIPRRAFVFQSRLSIATVFLPARSPTDLTVSGAIPSLLIGGQLGRWQLTIGASLLRLSSDVSSSTVFSVVPTVNFDMVRSKEEAVAFYLLAALPVGAFFHTAEGARISTAPSVGYDVGLGVRYSIHPQFALKFEAGVFGIFFDPGKTTNLNTTAIYGSFGAAFYLGK